MIKSACLDELKGQVVLADAAFGHAIELRAAVRLHALDYAEGIRPPTHVLPLDDSDRQDWDATSVGALATELGPRESRGPASSQRSAHLLGQSPSRTVLRRAIDGVGPEALVRNKTWGEVDGLALRVLPIDGLIANKVAAGRQQHSVAPRGSSQSRMSLEGARSVALSLPQPAQSAELP